LPDPRYVEFSLTDRARMTMLEMARACADADVGPQDADALFAGIVRKQLTGAEFLAGVTLVHAMALQVMRREEPELTLADALGWDLHVTEGEPDRAAEIEAELVVGAAIVTGLSPREARDVTAAELDVYRRARTAGGA
jgi:hypothetical protein